ncbi:hypothetical protein [Singulisphaera sp. PoT]|uniref:hypothetical protein n=1 Tax=Singulisphaera sp. PoT TaxID=3411797 RepID=UPI003BF48A91
MPAEPILPKAQNVEEANAWLALVDVLTNDEMLKDVVRMWRTWTGESDDSDPPAESQCPWIRLTPAPSQITIQEVDAYRLALAVQVETLILGTNVVDNLNLWGLIRRAMQRSSVMFTGDNVAGYLRKNGCYFYQLVKPSVAIVGSVPGMDRPVKAIRSEGGILLSLFVS